MGAFIWNEVDLFLQSAWYGMMLGMSYDVIRILRRIVKHKNIIVYIEDYLFWVVWGVILFALIFNYNDGNVRGYVFAGVIIGGLLYTKSFSGFLVKYISIVLNKIITLVLKKPAKAVKIVIMKPVRYLKKGIKRVYGRLGKKKEE
ncbi:MAG: spore cortex biosynthesis protein YabQ [Lachnospiraceae bacterium]